MDFLLYLLQRVWTWVANHGLAIAALVILVVLVPRICRFIIAVATSNMSAGSESAKGRRALIGAVVYIVEMVAYFIIGAALLKQFGVSLTAAAIPATVVSAAIGFGAQGVIGDLIGGVFIIAEKQYGIGDWVEFHSPSGSVQGDVVNMTLRATTIRTLNGEEIVVPNAEARMCVNYSSQWSRAVIEIPVPMTAGGSIRDLEERTLEAARRAIGAEGVKEHVLSEIRIQSSTELVPPTTMGLPWTVTMRLIVDCEPGDQWLIERAVRSEIIDTWWDDYGERAEGTPLTGSMPLTAAFGAPGSPVRRPGSLDDGPAAFVDAPTTVLGSERGAGPVDAAPGEAASRRGEGSLEVEQANAAAKAAAADGSDDERRRSDIPSAGARIEARRRKTEAELGDAGNEADSDSDAATKIAPAVAVGADGASGDGPADEAAVDDGPHWKDMSKRQRVRKVLSAGGRARPSTVVLIATLVVLGGLNLATVEPAEGEDGVAGWLAPSRFTNQNEDPSNGDGSGSTADTGSNQPTTTAPATTRPQQPQQDANQSGQSGQSGRTGQDGTRTDSGTDGGTGTGGGTAGDGSGTGTGGTGDGTATGGTGTGTGTGGTGAGTGTDSGAATGGTANQ